MMEEYDFTADWFGSNIENWTRDLGHLSGQPDVVILEIGSYEGRAVVWLLGNVLTHETARIDCVDVFHDPAYSRRFDHNVRTALGGTKVNKITGRSQDVLRQLRLEHYDAIYVDGSHAASDVLEDAVLGFRLLKHGGIMIFDDYHWGLQGDPLSTPKLAIDAFLAVYHGQYELLHHGYQVSIRRL
jgi:predicted O-methyltransferase YrrM